MGGNARVVADQSAVAGTYTRRKFLERHEKRANLTSLAVGAVGVTAGTSPATDALNSS